MSATVFYDNANELALISATFLNAAGQDADPTTVSCVVTDPVGGQVTHTYQGASPADIVKVGVGQYQLSVPATPSVAGADGLWSYVFIGTGAVSDVQPGTWRVFPLNIGTWYVGMEELKDRLGIKNSNDDSSVQRAIQSATGWVNEYCGRHFYQITEARTFRPKDIWLLKIDDVVSVTSVMVDQDGGGTFSTPYVQNVDFQLKVGPDEYNVNAAGIARPYTQMQIINSGKWWPFTWPFTHLDRVQVTGVWGWPVVPAPVTEATMILAADWFKMKDAPFGVAGMADYGVVKIEQNPWLIEQLKGFVKPRRKVGV